ncbi:MAG: hypothetical protein MOB07_02410 [Acidobacteria bacterium]|nr:hypothetical protein [Acidobacteriota bacterium]
MEVNVSPETESQLSEMAEQIGVRVADYAGFLLEKKVREYAEAARSNGGSSENLDEDPYALEHAIAKLLSRTPEEVEQTRARIFQASRPPRPLPEGKTLYDVVCGQWPGDETDEEVFEALKRLS